MGWECLQFQSILSFDIEMILGNLGQVEDEIDEFGVGISLTSTLHCYPLLRYWAIEVGLEVEIEVGLGMWPFPNLCCHPVLRWRGQGGLT